MLIEIKVPTPGESITEVEIGKWLVNDGDIVEINKEIAEIESDKATLSLISTDSGKINIIIQEGEKIAVGKVACTIDTDFAVISAKIPDVIIKSEDSSLANTTEKELVGEAPKESENKIKITSVAKKIMEENHLSVNDVLNGLRRLTKDDVNLVLSLPKSDINPEKSSKEISREVKTEKMSSLRRKLSERLVSVKNETAMLTTFNEIDMSRVIEMRASLQSKFVSKYGLKFGYMSIFTKAVAEAIQFHPSINSQINDDEIISPEFIDIGIAVQTPKGLMVPIIRNAESKTIPEIELEIKELAEKARNKKISVSELTGGTFTITNGGTFGSLLSTPIINPPQSAILGMHNIVDRPVAINGKVEIRPMMYIALSYDHRIIDGKDSVGFLVKLKEFIENPERLLNSGKSFEEVLLGL